MGTLITICFIVNTTQLAHCQQPQSLYEVSSPSQIYIPERDLASLKKCFSTGFGSKPFFSSSCLPILLQSYSKQTAHLSLGSILRSLSLGHPPGRDLVPCNLVLFPRGKVASTSRSLGPIVSCSLLKQTNRCILQLFCNDHVFCDLVLI